MCETTKKSGNIYKYVYCEKPKTLRESLEKSNQKPTILPTTNSTLKRCLWGKYFNKFI